MPRITFALISHLTTTLFLLKIKKDVLNHSSLMVISCSKDEAASIYFK